MRLGRCPNCGKCEVLRSRVCSVSDKLAFLFLLRPVRCHACMYRYFSPIWLGRSTNVVSAKPTENSGHGGPVDETRKSA